MDHKQIHRRFCLLIIAAVLSSFFVKTSAYAFACQNIASYYPAGRFSATRFSATRHSAAELNAHLLLQSAEKIAAYASEGDYSAIAGELDSEIFSAFESVILREGHVTCLLESSTYAAFYNIHPSIPDAYRYGIYIGSMAEDKRAGQGTWIVLLKDGMAGSAIAEAGSVTAVVSSGPWYQDVPSGEFEIRVITDNGQTAARYSGNVSGGLFNGNVSFDLQDQRDLQDRSLIRNYADGIPVKSAGTPYPLETAVLKTGDLREQQVILLGEELVDETLGVPGYCSHDWYTDTLSGQQQINTVSAAQPGLWIYRGLTYYIDRSGARQCGLIRLNDRLIYIPENGLVAKGWKEYGDSFFYITDNGEVAVSKEVIPYTVDENGLVIRAAAAGDPNGRDPLEAVIQRSLLSCIRDDMTKEQQLRACYDYVLRHTSYKRTYDTPAGEDWTKLYAEDVLMYGLGNCFRYAAAFAYLAAAIGYEVRICTGQISASRGGTTPHGWTEILIDGEWLIFDPDMQDATGGDYYWKTFAQYPVKPLIAQARWEVVIPGSLSVIEMKFSDPEPAETVYENQ